MMIQVTFYDDHDELYYAEFIRAMLESVEALINREETKVSIRFDEDIIDG